MRRPTVKPTPGSGPHRASADAPRRAPLALAPGSPGFDSLRSLPSALVRETLDLAGSEVALREFADPPRAEFVLAPSSALAIIVNEEGHYVLGTGPARSRRHALMSPGSSAVTSPGREVSAGWTSTTAQHFRSLHLHVAGRLLAETAQSLGTTTEPPDWIHRADDLVSTLVRRIDAGTRAAAPALHLDALVHSLLGHLLVQDRDRHRVQGLAADRLAKVVDLMHDRLHEPLTLEDLARHVHVSPHHFLRGFQRTTGSTPMRLLTRMRMDRAMRLLVGTDFTVQEVALRCGYTDASAFGAAFRRRTGRTPTQWRRQRPD